VYEAPGIYTATLSAENTAGVMSTDTVVSILDAPVSGLVAANSSPTAPSDVTRLTATVTSGTGLVYSWDFGDGAVGAGRVITHVYGTTGSYTATVTVTNAVGALSADTRVRVLEWPLVNSMQPRMYLPLMLARSLLPVSDAGHTRDRKSQPDV
jgi:PKD repeat protein